MKGYDGPKPVSDESVQLLLKPGLLPGAENVFLDFISYRYVKRKHFCLTPKDERWTSGMKMRRDWLG